MNLYILYFLVALLATTVGAVTGMGGGIIIKPALDMLGHFDAATINMLSSLTVTCMALVSVARHLRSRAAVNLKIALPLAAGSIGGGFLGGRLLGLVLRVTGTGRIITVTQNTLLAVIIAAVFIYMSRKQRLPTLGLSGTLPALLAGVGLGCLSAFLSIGGGPVNVAVIIFIFSMSTKQAALCSLITILFAQMASLVSYAASDGFGEYDLRMLPVMLAGAVMGGLLGAAVQRRLSEKSVDRLFNAVQIFVFGLCVVNILRGG